MDAFFDGFDGLKLPVWLALSAPTAGLAFALVLALIVVVRRAAAALRSDRPRPVDPIARALPGNSALPVSALTETRNDLPIIRTAIGMPRPPNLRPLMAHPALRNRLGSSVLRRRERRIALRRGGDPLPVEVSDREAKAIPSAGQVLDRSRSGLRLAVDQAIPVNSIISVRSSLYGEDASWIQLRVRHCRQSNERWMLGCQFTTEQPWSVLLLFG